MTAEHNTVYVVDDDHATRVLLAKMLEADGMPVEAYSSAEAFLAGFDPDRAAGAVLDMRMPGMDGLDLCEKVRGEHPDLPVIILTGYGDAATARRSFKMGAVDFVEKPFSKSELLDLVREGVARAALSRKRSERRALISARMDQLSARELEVLELVVGGALNKQMASALGIHDRTIEYHRRNIMRKMKAESVPQLVEMTLACSG